jgi:AcrR family transcriptional regulator
MTETLPKKGGRKERDATFWKILSAALELDFRKGHLKWTMSELSRKSTITRSLIYYHFGRSKAGILQEAVRVVGEELVGLGPERVGMWRSGKMVDSLKAARALAKEAPYLGQFYLSHREKPTDVGSALRRIETEYLKKLATFFPAATDVDRRTLFTVFFGMCFSPFSDDNVIELLAESVRKVIG